MIMQLLASQTVLTKLLFIKKDNQNIIIRNLKFSFKIITSIASRVTINECAIANSSQCIITLKEKEKSIKYEKFIKKTKTLTNQKSLMMKRQRYKLVRLPTIDLAIAIHPICFEIEL